MNDMPIYFDYMATTPVDPEVIEVMMRYLGPDGCFGNAASTTHAYGQAAAVAIDQARTQIAHCIQATPQEIVFTSGATEANNLAILGAARFYQNKGKHIITLSTEHKAVLDTCRQLEQEGFELTYLNPQPDGLLDIDSLRQALRDDTILVSIMHVNNEIGVIQDLVEIGRVLHKKGIIFHVDAAQSAGRCIINLKDLAVDLMSFSAHKMYGPKGIGALYVRHKPRIRLQPQSFGGGHEGGLRSGTLATHQIVGMAAAFVKASSVMESEQSLLLNYRTRLWQGIKHLPGLSLNGHEQQRIAGNLNITCAGLDGDALLLALKDLALSSTSACTSSSTQPSYVLKALGLSDEEAYASIRLSLGRFTKEEHIDQAIAILCTQISRLHEMKPR